MQLVFVVESDPSLSQILEAYLARAGYSVSTFGSPAEVVGQAERLRPALILIDAELRTGDALELCRRLRRTPMLCQTPLILINYSSTKSARIAGLDAGADDCIAKPFTERELLARVQTTVRRNTSVAGWPRGLDKDGVILLGELEIDALAMRLSIAGKDVGATTLEFRLIQHLARNHGRVFTRDELLDAVWGNTEFVTPRSVDTCIRRIRKKIEVSNGTMIPLRTIRGVGYRLDAPARQAANGNELRTWAK